MLIKEDNLNRLYQYARAITNNDDLAYDLVHDAILRSRKYFILNQQAYLKKSIRNLFYSQYRKSIKESQFAEEREVVPLSFDDIIVEKNEVEFILNLLEPTEREMIFLSLVEDYSYKEIAIIMDIKIGTVMSRLSRCKEKIRRHYEKA